MEDGPCLRLELNLDGRPREAVFFDRLANIGQQKGAGHLSLALERPVEVAFLLLIFEEKRAR